MMSDTASLHVLLDSLVDRTRFPAGRIQFRYTLVTEEAVVAGNQMMARWVMSTTNATQLGAKNELTKQGMLCCKFNSGYKITGLEFMFDVMAFMLQLKQAAASDGFSVVPNTVQTCQRTFEKPVVMTSAEPPYTIVQVNSLWEDMTGYAADQVVGKASCAILQGASTDRKSLVDMMEEVRYKRPAFSTLINYKKTGAVFRNFLFLYPLSTDSRISHYLAVTEHAEYKCPDLTVGSDSNAVASVGHSGDCNDAPEPHCQNAADGFEGKLASQSSTHVVQNSGPGLHSSFINYQAQVPAGFAQAIPAFSHAPPLSSQGILPTSESVNAEAIGDSDSVSKVVSV
jgi:PAS domain S-box-containing protein